MCKFHYTDMEADGGISLERHLLSPDIYSYIQPPICISQKLYPEAIVNVVLHHLFDFIHFVSIVYY